MTLKESAVEKNALIAHAYFMAAAGNFARRAVGDDLHTMLRGNREETTLHCGYATGMRRLAAIIIAFLFFAPLSGYAANATATMLARREARLRQRARPSSSVTETLISPPSRTISQRPSSTALSSRKSRTTQPFVLQQTRILFTLVNEAREEHGVPPLRRSAMLDAAAQAHAEDMTKHEYFAHESPTGELYDKRIQRAGYPGKMLDSCDCSLRAAFAENLAKGQRLPEEVVHDWLASPPHRANLLDPNLADVGYGLSRNIWVQNFGRITLIDREGNVIEE